MLKSRQKNGIFSKIDPVLFACTVALSLISCVTVFGAMDNFGTRKLIMQVAMTLAGVVATVVIAQFDYHWIVDKLWIIMIGVSVLLLGITLVFGSSGENMETANRSWLKIPGIGIMIQPSEFVKIALVCSFAKHISMVRERINHIKELAGLAIHAGLIVGLILLVLAVGIVTLVIE